MASFARPPSISTKLREAREKLVNSPHKSVLLALETKSERQEGGPYPDEAEWEQVKAAALKRLQEDLYTALKVNREAKPAEIKKGYFQLSKLYHPDKTRMSESSELFQLIKRAFDVLSEDQSRASYDHRTKGKSFVPSAEAFKENVPNRSQPKKASPAPPPPTSKPTPKPPSTKPPPPPPPPFNRQQQQQKPPPPQPKPASGKRPLTPHSLDVVQLDGESVTLSWKTREADAADITYELQTRLVYEVGWPKSAPGIKQPVCRKKNLKPSTAYSFTVRAVSGATGLTSAWSVPLRVDTPAGPSSHKSSGPPPPPPPYHSTEDGRPHAERRYDPYNGHGYTRAEFVEYYGGSAEWDAAKEVAPPKPFFRPKATSPPSAPKPTASSAEVPPGKPYARTKTQGNEWACTVCRRNNSPALKACGTCGTTQGYTNERMDRVKETAAAKASREKERERLRERIKESAKAAEREAAARGTTPRTSTEYSFKPPPPPAAGGWARDGNPAFASGTTCPNVPPPAPPPPPRPASAPASRPKTTEQPSSARPSTARAAPDHTSKPPSSSPSKEQQKAASAARKARRASMREVLKEKTAQKPTAPSSSGQNTPTQSATKNILFGGGEVHGEPSGSAADTEATSAKEVPRTAALLRKLGVKFSAGMSSGVKNMVDAAKFKKAST